MSPSKKVAKAVKTTADDTVTDKRGRRTEFVGQVVSDKMQKTISVLVYRQVRHARYGKFIRKTSVFKAHDEKNEAKTGDRVLIIETRPLSSTKRWRLSEIVERAKVEGEVAK